MISPFTQAAIKPQYALQLAKDIAADQEDEEDETDETDEEDEDTEEIILLKSEADNVFLELSQ